MNNLLEYEVSNDPNRQEIEELMLKASHNIGILNISLAGKKDVAARAKIRYTKEYTLAYLEQTGTEPHKKAKALVSENVLNAQADLDRANAEELLVKALLDTESDKLDVFKKIANNRLEEYKKERI